MDVTLSLTAKHFTDMCSWLFNFIGNVVFEVFHYLG